MGKLRVDGSPYRIPVTPDCPCARCSVKTWRLSLAWMFWRILVVAGVAGMSLTLVIAAANAFVRNSKVSPPCYEEACRDRVNIVGKGSTPYACSHIEHRMAIVELHDNEVEVRCLCGGHDAGAPPAFVP